MISYIEKERERERNILNEKFSLRLIIYHLKCFKIIFLIIESLSPYNRICLSFLAPRVSLHVCAAHALLPPTEPFTYASEFQMVSELLVETPLCLPWSILRLKWSIPKIFTRNDTSFTHR